VRPYLPTLPIEAVEIGEDWAVRNLLVIARDFAGLSPAARALLATLTG
jgi:phage terminase small subunit